MKEFREKSKQSSLNVKDVLTKDNIKHLTVYVGMNRTKYGSIGT